MAGPSTSTAAPAAKKATPAAAAKEANGTATAGKKQAPAKKKQHKIDPHVVIVRNAEVDLAAIHAEAVARFVVPRADKADAVHSSSRCPAVTVREETLTALVRLDPRAYSLDVDALKQEMAKRVLFGKPVHVAGSTEGAKRVNELQANLARATLSTSRNVTAEALHDHLKEVPGYVACRRVRSQVFHAVFIDAAALMSTKMLLDEFEADGLRITVQLSKSLEDAYDAFVREKLDAGGDADEPADA